MSSTKHALIFLAFWQLFAVALASPQLGFALNSTGIPTAKMSAGESPEVVLSSKHERDHPGFPAEQPIKPSETEKDSEEKDNVRLRPPAGHALQTNILLYFFFTPAIDANELFGSITSIPLYMLFHSWKSYLN